MDRAEAVDKRLRELIAEGGGAVRLTTAKNSLTYLHRVALPLVLASGAYVVTDEPGGLLVRLREAS